MALFAKQAENGDVAITRDPQGPGWVPCDATAPTPGPGQQLSFAGYAMAPDGQSAHLVWTVVPIPVADQSAATLRARAAGALQTNRDFVALNPPTAAQVAAQVAALSRQNIALIRLVVGLLDATD